MHGQAAAVVRQSMQAYNDGDYELSVGLMHPDIDYVPLLAAMEGRAYRGRAGALAFFRALELDWEVFLLDPHEFYERGDRVLAVGTWRSKARSSGLELDSQLGGWVVTVEDGLMTRWRTYSRREEAVADFGVAESDLESCRVEFDRDG